MISKQKTIQLLTILLLTLFITACSSGSSSSTDAEKETTVIAQSKQSVSLSSTKADSYSWTQVSGESIIMIDSKKQNMSFIAPKVDKEIELLFEVKMIVASKVQTKRVKVIVKPLQITIDTNETNTDSNTTDSNTTDTNTTTTITNNLVSITLNISNNSLNIDTNATLNAVATYEDNTTKDITDTVEWISSDSNAVLITKRHLQAKKETNIILQAKLNAVTSNAVALEIYQEINGHRLPAEPNKTLNDSTLLGIDSNNNGVRDDVERWIYTYYAKPIEHAVFMQSARAYQIVIQEPEKALENLPVMQASTRCKSYWRLRAKRKGELFWLERYKDYSKEIYPEQFNTAARFLAYKKYNQTLSGGVYSGDKIETWKSKCDFNTTTLIKKP